MTEIETASAMELIGDLFSKVLPKDVAEGWLKKLDDERKAQENKRYTATVLANVTAALENVGEALMKAIPAGREIRIFHRPALAAKDGVPGVDAALHFSIETSGSQTSTGKATPRETGKLIRVTLDGKDIEGSTWRAALDKVNEALEVALRLEIPGSAFSANSALHGLAKRVNKKAGRERIVVHGNVNEGKEAPEVTPAPDAAPDATVAPEAPETAPE